MFINVTAQDWKTITAPKLRGAWNMHELAPQDLDFFVSLGSIVGRLGNVGQSIYAGTSVSPSFGAFPPSSSTLTDATNADVPRQILSIPQQAGPSGGHSQLASRSRH
jgi:hypothetical protein